ncbi:Co-chaperone Hsc20 [Lojkania enalia]|uniref:Co-chaperone Hsc20 n=1 Tax=Lojkania enalia TaxID=147567 RepID=A0A9P4TQY3_9PLEO|nr:Co-chaperone Hsc20 [Didymosphaeria enalia]
MMRPTSPAAMALLRSTVSEASRVPLRTRQTATPCIFCANHKYRSHSAPQRYSSTSSKADASKPHTHYSLFPESLPAGPPPSGRFHVDLPSLKKEFLQLQAQAHPDRHPPATKIKAQALSARINEAYKTLQNPLLRAQYLLSLRGIDVHVDESAKVEDPQLLMEVLEAREQIEEAENEEDLVEMKAQNEDRIANSVKILEEAFEKDDVEGAKHEAVRLRYWINIEDSLQNWEKGKPVVLAH